MKCSDKEWQHCQKEKRGCEGCFYNDEISIGEYVRSWDGTIGKVTRIEEGIFLYDNKELICFIRNVVKHSKEPIDLVQKGDYVNGYLVEQIDKDGFIVIHNGGYTFRNSNWIKTIITKEQIKQIEFRIKE